MITFIPIIPERIEFAPPLPTCPDGSGDLWWDDASYIRYQAYDMYDVCEPAHLQRETVTADFCDGPVTLYYQLEQCCPRHRAAYEALRSDPPF